MNKKITCGYCKKEISEDSKKCQYCGEEFGGSNIKRKIKNKAIWIGVIIGIIAGILFYQFFYRYFYFTPFIFIILCFILLGSLLGFIANIKKENMWFLYLVLFFVVAICAYLTIKEGLHLLIVFSPLLFLLILYISLYDFISQNTIMKGAVVGGVIGWIWGFVSLFLGVALLEREITFINVLIVLPIYLSRAIFESERLFISSSLVIGSTIGLIIGSIIGMVLTELK